MSSIHFQVTLIRYIASNTPLIIHVHSSHNTILHHTHAHPNKIDLLLLTPPLSSPLITFIRSTHSHSLSSTHSSSQILFYDFNTRNFSISQDGGDTLTSGTFPIGPGLGIGGPSIILHPNNAGWMAVFGSASMVSVNMREERGIGAETFLNKTGSSEGRKEEGRE